MTNPGQGPIGPEAEVSDEPARLRATEIELARMQGEIGSGIRERVAKLEQDKEHFAARGDIARLETRLATLEERSKHMATRAWVLGGVLGGMATTAGMATAIALAVVKMYWNPG